MINIIGKLLDTKGKELLRGLRPDAPLTGEGDDEEEDAMDEIEKEEEDDCEENEGPSSRPHVSRAVRGMIGTGGTIFEDDFMKVVVRSSRFIEHHSWPEITHMVWDRESQQIEEGRRRQAELLERQAEMMQ